METSLYSKHMLVIYIFNNLYFISYSSVNVNKLLLILLTYYSTVNIMSNVKINIQIMEIIYFI